MKARAIVVAVLLLAGWAIACGSAASAAQFVVDPQAAAARDGNPGTAAKPLKTLSKALQLAKGGDTILLGTGAYPAVSITRTYEKPLTICAAKGARPVMTGGLSVTRGGGVRVAGLVFTWPEGRRPSTAMTPFISISGSKDVEVAQCEIFDDPKRTEWVGHVCSVNDSQGVNIHDCKAHNFYFGFSAYHSKDVTFRNLDIRAWSHEDGIRVTECEGPVLIEGCNITNTGTAGVKSGHVDGIQVVYWADNLTIRNCRIHGMGQGIGAFAATNARSDRRRKNWRIEGNLVYDVYAPHVCTVLECDGVTVINNTFPQNRPILSKCTAAVLKNNIIGQGNPITGDGIDADYNLYTSGRGEGAAHDLVGVDPKFVSRPELVLRTDYHNKEVTRSKLIFRGRIAGQVAKGDVVEVMNTDGSARDAKGRKVTAVGDNWLEIDPPLDADPDWAGVFVYKWPAGQKNLVPDYHLRPDSPAVDSADSSVGRGPDMEGHKATDVRTVPNTGAGDVKYLDRGAFELGPAR